MSYTVDTRYRCHCVVLVSALSVAHDSPPGKTSVGLSSWWLFSLWAPDVVVPSEIVLKLLRSCARKVSRAPNPASMIVVRTFPFLVTGHGT